MDLQEIIDEKVQDEQRLIRDVNPTVEDDDLLSNVNIDEVRADLNQDEDLFPVGLIDNEAETVTARQLLADIDREDAMVETLSRCPI